MITKTIEDGYEVRRDETGKLLGWRLLDVSLPGLPRPAVKTAPGMSTKSATTSAPVGPVYTFREVRNADGTIGAEKVDASGTVVARLAMPPAGEIIETDWAGNPLLAERLNVARIEDRKTDGNDFADAVEARNDADDDLEIA